MGHTSTFCCWAKNSSTNKLLEGTLQILFMQLLLTLCTQICKERWRIQRDKINGSPVSSAKKCSSSFGLNIKIPTNWPENIAAIALHVTIFIELYSHLQLRNHVHN